MIAEQNSGLLTIVIPVFNEIGSLERLHGALTSALGALHRSCEIIYVDDGSTDGSAAALDDLAIHDTRVRVVHFCRNFGKSAALDAGFRNARGVIVVTLDADMQNDPVDIPRFVDKIEHGADAVSGWRRQRRDGAAKVMPSGIFNSVVRRISGSAIHDFNCGFKAYRAQCLTGLRLYGGLHRYILVLLQWNGCIIDEIEITHHARRAGQSKFGAGRIVTSAFDLLTVLLITRFRSRPLHLFGYTGLISGVLGLLALAYAFMKHPPGASVTWPEPAAFVALILILASVLLIGMGLIGEMLKNLIPSAAPDYLIRSIAETEESDKGISADAKRLAQ